MIKKGTAILLVLTAIAGISSFSLVEKMSYGKGTIGDLKVHVVESNTVKNHIRNSFGGGATSCIESYNANLETTSQDTMIAIGVSKKSIPNGDCNTHAPMSEIFKKEKLPLSVSGSNDMGKFGSLKVKIGGKMYATSIKVQPEGSSFVINAVTPIQTNDSDLLMSYKNFYRVDGVITARLFNAMVAGDYVDVKDFAFSSVFAENK